MSERIRKTIYEIEYKSDTAQVAKTTETLTRAETAFDKTTQAAKEFEVEQKKVSAESQKVGASIDNTGKKFGALGQQIQKAGDNIGKLSTFRGLQKVFDDNANALTPFISQINKLSASLANTSSVDEMKQSLIEFKNSLPADLQLSIGDKLIKEFDQLNTKLATPAVRLREIRNLLLQGGLPKEQVEALKNEAGKLTDQISDLKQELRNVGDNQLGFRALTEGAQVAFGAVSAFQGIVALTGSTNEEFQQAMLKTQGALAALTGIQQLANSLQKESAFVVGLQTAAQKVQNFFVDEATGKVKKLNVALALSVAGIIIAGVIALAKNWDKVSVALGFATRAQQEITKVNEKAAESVAQESAELEISKRRLQDLSLPMKTRKEIVDDLQKKYPGLLANEAAENELLAGKTGLLDKVSAALLLNAKVKAVADLVGEEFKKQITIENQALEENLTTIQKVAIEYQKLFAPDQGKALGTIIGFKNRQESLAEIKTTTDRLIDLGAEFQIALDALGGDPTKQTEAIKQVKDNQLAELNERERHALALLQLIKDSEIKQLELKIDFANQRLALLKKTNKDESLEVVRQINEIEELNAQLSKANTSDLIKGSIDFLSAEISKFEAAMNAVEGKSDEFFAIADKLPLLRKQLQELQDLANPKEAEKKEFSSDLDEAERHQTALLGIEGAGQQEILDTQIAFQKARIQELIEHNADVEEIEKAQNTLAELEAEKTAILRSEQDKRNQIIADGILEVGNALADATSQFIDFQIRETDRLIQAQQGRVDAAKAIAEKGNAELLQLEEERLNELNKKRERFVRSQQALAAIQLVAEASLAVAKAAAEGGAAAPFTIAATLIALAIGLQQARALASAAAFYEGGPADWSELGGFTGKGNPRSRSTNIGRKPYTYHREEYIMPHQVTAIGNNREWFEKIHNERIDLNKLFKPSNIVQFAGADNRELIDAIKEIPGVQLNMNSKGIITIVHSHQKRNSKLQSRR